MFCRSVLSRLCPRLPKLTYGFVGSGVTPLHQSSASLSQAVERLRYMQRLKENDQACRDALAEGYFSVFCDLNPILSREGILWNSYADVVKSLSPHSIDPLRDSVFLSYDDEGTPPKFAINVSSGQKRNADRETARKFAEHLGETLGGRTCSIRKAIFVLPQDAAQLISLAYSLLHWHAQTGFCSCCGQVTTRDISGYKRTCTSCSETSYPVVQPVAITLVTDGDRCVLARQPRFPPQMYSALAGFCEPGESVAMTVQREVAEEIGLDVDRIDYLDSQPWPFPGTSLMLGFYAQLREGSTDEIKIDTTELEEAKWISREELKTLLSNDNGKSIGLVGGPDIYIPPPQAIGHQLIKAWTFQK